MRNLRIVFMGTPEFAVASLGALLMNCFNVVAVVTAPDKPAGRGRKISKPAVKQYAELSCLPVLQPTNLKDLQFIDSLSKLNPDLFVVVAFRMLPECVWKIPPLGTINLHASLLPQYRGAAPVNHAIINGESVTGVTTFMIDEQIDTGRILLSEEVQIYPFENAGDLHDRLMKHGARLLVRTIAGLAENSIEPKPQEMFIISPDKLKKAPKITPEFCIIDWDQKAHELYNFVRGLSPYPCARSFFAADASSVSFKIFECDPEVKTHSYKPGTIVSDGKNNIRIACSDGFISINSLQAEGRKKMTVSEFLRGFNIKEYSVKQSGKA